MRQREYRSETMIDGYEIRHVAYCGMAWTVTDWPVEDIAAARARLADIAAARSRAGYPVEYLDADTIEIGEPEGAALVPDTCGVTSIRAIGALVAECWNCGSEVRIGECCDCNDPIDDDDPQVVDDDEDDDDGAADVCGFCDSPVTVHGPGRATCGHCGAEYHVDAPTAPEGA